MNLSDLDRNIQDTASKLGYEELLPVQKRGIDVLLHHQDCVIQSHTGSGKTAAYCIPIIQNTEIDQNAPQALILAPTRELALQIRQEVNIWGMHNKIKSVCLIGQQPFEFQKVDLAQRCHVVIGTPGRVLHHLEQGTLNTKQIQYVVVDEADKMFDQNFKETIETIVSGLPYSKTLCFVSATLGSEIKELASVWMEDPQIIINEEKRAQIQQYKVTLYDQDPFEIAARLLIQIQPSACILFCQRRTSVNALYDYLRPFNLKVKKIHAGLTQEERMANMNAFRSGESRFLIASDVVSRGIDVEKVPLIINVDKPESEVSYTHRIGRSARVYEKGMAVTLVNKDDPAYAELPEYHILEKPIDERTMKVLQGGERQVQHKMEQARKGIVKLYLNIGKKKRIRTGDIVGALCGLEGIDINDIGVIQIQDNQSYVDIFHGKEGIVLKQLKTIKKKHVKAEVARS